MKGSGRGDVGCEGATCEQEDEDCAENLHVEMVRRCGERFKFQVEGFRLDLVEGHSYAECMVSVEGQNDEPLLRTHSCARLDELLDERNARPERRRQIDRVITRDFAATRAILVLDMAGFSFSCSCR